MMQEVNRLDRQRLEDVRDAAKRIILERTANISNAMFDKDGLIFGDVKLTRRERILSTLDRQDRGILQNLAQIDQKTHDQILQQLDRDLSAEGITNRGQDFVPAPPPPEPVAEGVI
jgi:hypothetical protein